MLPVLKDPSETSSFPAWKRENKSRMNEELAARRFTHAQMLSGLRDKLNRSLWWIFRTHWRYRGNVLSPTGFGLLAFLKTSQRLIQCAGDGVC